ncbi:MAG: hypothetical protein C0506_14010, partial [Anaerolinea sp.]|nr:hypothetical protein [Anaerolinea sp.]
RFELYQPVQEFLTNALAWDNVELLPLGPAIAARAGALGRPMHGDPADRLIVASALELALPLVTRDARIRALPGVVTVW